MKYKNPGYKKVNIVIGYIFVWAVIIRGLLWVFIDLTAQKLILLCIILIILLASPGLFNLEGN